MNIYELLKNDHDEIRNMLNELIALKDDDEYRFVLIEQIKNELIPHSRAEESVFYNTIRAVDADKSIVAHGYTEHMEAEGKLRLLQIKDKADFDWRGTAKSLLESLEHHIAEEESKIFDEAKIIFTDQEAEAIGDAFAKLKPTFVGEGVMKSTVDMVINMLPPRLVDGIRNLGSSNTSQQ